MATGTAPTLPLPLEEFAGLLERGVAPPEFYGNDELHQLELTRIFGTAWNFVGFESEIPNGGDYVQRFIGNDRFIVTRDENNEISVLLDRCLHRGTHVCRAEDGNASEFTCPYHGWTYNLRGELVGVPLMRHAYGSLEKKEWGLRRAPRIATLYGLIFASLKEEGPSFEEFLGNTKWYLDAVFGCWSGPLDVVGVPHRWVLNTNWKIGPDNFGGDDYHTLSLHRSMFDVNALPIDPIDNMKGYHIALDGGSSITFSCPDTVFLDSSDQEDDADAVKFVGWPEEAVATIREDNLTKEQYELIKHTRIVAGNVFPTFSFLSVPASPDPDTPPVPFFIVRSWRPLGKDKTVAYNWQLVPPGISDELRDASYAAGANTFGPCGTFEQDDTVPWAHISRNAQGTASRLLGYELNYQMGMPGRGTARSAPEFPGPGKVTYPRWEEGNQRHFLRAYMNAMHGK